jgi:uncharacterized protein YndB with AHSA1/START domain
METDLPRHIGAVARTVTTRENQRVVIASRTYDTTPDDVWEAITSPPRIARWFVPVSGDLRLGGRFQIQGNASGEITACDPPKHLALTWEAGGQNSTVDVKLTADQKGGTRLTLEHVLPHDPKWDEFGPGAVGVGWDLTLFGLHNHFASNAASADPREKMAWLFSNDGKEFVRGTSDEWYRAAVTGGADPSSARAAADRTTAAYTGSAPAKA